MTERKGDVGAPAEEMPNEWGIPNWKKAANYGNTKNWTRNRWRWEFVRRRCDVREAFEEAADPTYIASLNLLRNGPEVLRGRVPLKTNEPGFTADHPLAKTLGLAGLPNPKIGDQPFYVISFDDWSEVLTLFSTKKPPENSLRIDFDVNKPLEPQLKSAKQLLKSAQINLHGKTLQSRRHSKKWLVYLRTLDARASNASWSEISILHSNTAQTEQTARDVWKAADDLRFNF